MSIDTSFPMANNFFELFLTDPFVKANEIIVVVDGNDNSRIHNLLKGLEIQYPNMRTFFCEKMGYGAANNFAVGQSKGEFLFFINSDVFTDNSCYEKMLRVLQEKKAECVQPLLVYPQSKTVQCAGTFFGPYFKEHLFDGNSITAPVVLKSGYRQALTSALYAMPRDVFKEYGGFDEFYFNKLESFELSYKITQHGQRCYYLADALAYHSRGAGRGQYTFDFRQQEAFFWSRFGSTIKPDIDAYLSEQVIPTMQKMSYYVIIMNQVRSWKSILEKLPLSFSAFQEMSWIPTSSINLFDTLPHNFLLNPAPLAFVVTNIRQLRNNRYWFELRNNPNDIIIDNYANLILANEWAQ